MKFSDILKSIRKSICLNQSEFGKVVGLTQQAISELEKGKNKPSNTLLKFMEYRYGDNFGASGEEISSTSDKDDIKIFQNGPDQVIPIDPAVRVLREAEKDAGIVLNPRQRESVMNILRKDLERKEKEAKAEITDLVASFKDTDDDRRSKKTTDTSDS